MRTLLLILSPLAIVMPALLLRLTWSPSVLAKHAKHDLSIQWTRALLAMTLVVVLVFIVVLPRL